MNTKLLVATFALTGGLLACSHGTVPVRHVAETEAAYRAAQAVDAERVPQAALHLQLAREQMARAQKLINAKEFERADGALLRAKIDADLAAMIAQREKTSREAQAALSELAKVRDQGSDPNDTKSP